jgi:hypothetical protein
MGYQQLTDITERKNSTLGWAFRSWQAAAFDRRWLPRLAGGYADTHKEVLMTDESQKANLPGPGETEGGRIDPSNIPEEAREDPALRVPKGDQDDNRSEPAEPNAPPRPVQSEQ